MTISEAKTNMSPSERLIWGAAGATLVVFGLTRRGNASKVAALLGGGGALAMAATGHDPINAALRIRETEDGGVLVERAVTIGKPRQEVYAYWRKLSNLPSFMSHLERVEETSATRSHWVAKAPAGAAVEWDAEITADQPGEKLAWKSTESAQIPNEGEVQFFDAPGDRGTEVRVRLAYHPPAGTFGAFVARLFQQEPSQQIQDDLKGLKRLMELGYKPTSNAQSSGRPTAGTPKEGSQT